MPQVASKAGILQSQQAGLGRRERAGAPTADQSPFSILLAETGNSQAPAPSQSARAQASAPSPRSETTRPDAPRNEARRSDAQRSQTAKEDRAAEPDAPEAETAEDATTMQPDDALLDAFKAVATVQTADGAASPTEAADSDAASDEVIAIDAAPAATVERPASPEQPAVIAMLSLAPAVPAAAVPPPGAAPAADGSAETGAAVAPAAGALPAAPAVTPQAADGEGPVPELEQGEISQAPLVPEQATPDAVTATSLKPQAKPSAEPPVAPTMPAVTPEQRNAALAPEASAPTTAEAQPVESQTEAAPQQPAHVEKRSRSASEPQAPEATERAPTRSPVSEFAQSNRPTPDMPHAPHLQIGREFGQAVAATAHASQNADASNPLVSAPVALESVAVEIAARAQSGRNRFEIRLDPPELGRIEVRLDIDRSGQVTSRLVVDKAETLEVLRRDAHQLERALQDAGLKTSDNGLQFSLRDQPFAQRNDQGGSDHRQVRIVDPELPAAEGTAHAYGVTLRGGSGVDIRV